MGKYTERSYDNWSEDSIRMFITTSRSAKSMYYYVQEIGYFKAFGNYYTERENLGSFLVVYTISGSGFLQYRGKGYNLAPGQVFFIDCMEYQLYKSSGGVPWEFLWVHFNGSSSLAYFDQYVKNGTPVAGIRDEYRVKQILWDLIEVNRSRDFMTEPVSSKLITDLLTELIISAHISTTMPHTAPQYIRDILNYIEKNYMDKITLDMLSVRFAVNKFQLLKNFKKHVGLTPNDYVMSCRINRAKELLKYSGLSVGEISYHIGIENISHFINLFKKHEHRTPLTFRNEWNEVNN